MFWNNTLSYPYRWLDLSCLGKKSTCSHLHVQHYENKTLKIKLKTKSSAENWVNKMGIKCVYKDLTTFLNINSKQMKWDVKQWRKVLILSEYNLFVVWYCYSCIISKKLYGSIKTRKTNNTHQRNLINKKNQTVEECGYFDPLFFSFHFLFSFFFFFYCYRQFFFLQVTLTLIGFAVALTRLVEVAILDHFELISFFLGNGTLVFF